MDKDFFKTVDITPEEKEYYNIGEKRITRAQIDTLRREKYFNTPLKFKCIKDGTSNKTTK